MKDIKKEAQNIGTPNLMDMLGKQPATGGGQVQAPHGGGIMSFWPGGKGVIPAGAVHLAPITDRNSVIHMQQELLNMSDDIQKTEALAAKNKQVESRPVGEPKTVRDESGTTSTWQPEREAGYRTFLSFLSEYAPPSAGREHSEYAKPGKPDERKFPGVTKRDQFYDRSNMGQFDMKNFLQSIPRVGKHVAGQENKPDGVWGPMTQTALENTFAFAKTMLNFSEGMNVQEKIFTNADLREFHNLILPEPKDNQEKVSKAGALVPILQKVHQLFNSFNTKFIEKGGKGWGDYTSQEKAFVDYKKNEDVAKTGLDLYISKLDPEMVIGKVTNDVKGGGELTDITVGDLQSVNSFKKFIDDARMQIGGHLIDINNANDVLAAFNYVKSILAAKPTDLQQVTPKEKIDPGY